MKSANKHPQENLRLESLRAQKILDTLPESDFDDLTLIASQICGMPIALISLVDEDRQWFKAKVGLSISETPRDIAFCAHAILQADVFEIPDSTLDSRFADNPLVTGTPPVAFYAGAPLLSPDGLPIGTLCVIDHKPRKLSAEQKQSLQALSNQITQLLELKTQIQKLKESKELLIFKRTAVESIAEGIVLQDSTGQIIDFNAAALKVLGLTGDELQGKKSTDKNWQAIRKDGSPFPGTEHPAMVTLATGFEQKNVLMGIRRPPEELRWITINSVPIFLNGSSKPSHCVTSFADITDSKHLEAAQRTLELQLIESSRLSALGEMAGGIAHEINNPLSIIRGKSSIIKRKIESGILDKASLNKDLESIEKTVDRIAKIIRGLKTYSRDAENDPFDTTDLTTIANDTLALCQEKFKTNNVLIRVVGESDLKIDCRPAQISQILMNLLTNSFDAIVDKSEKWIEVNIQQNDNKAFVSVTDSGSGIEPAVLEKIMNPFFTTKEVGKGTGLGLSISKGIAESHGGCLDYDSTKKNTSFLLTLPLRQTSNLSRAS